MTIKAAYYYTLQEIDKVKMVNYLLEDFNRDFNWAVDTYVKIKYLSYDVTQGVSDDLQNLKGIAIVDNIPALPTIGGTVTAALTVAGSVSIPITITKTKWGISFPLPSNYYHYLKSFINLNVLSNYACYTTGTVTEQEPRRLTDTNSIVGFYDRPTYRNPYYYIFNNTAAVTPNIEILTNDLGTAFSFNSIDIRYLKVPIEYNLTETQFNNPIDVSQVIEFPNYVCIEFLKSLTTKILERYSDPRFQSFPAVSNTEPRQQ